MDIFMERSKNIGKYGAKKLVKHLLLCLCGGWILVSIYTYPRFIYYPAKLELSLGATFGDIYVGDRRLEGQEKRAVAGVIRKTMAEPLERRFFDPNACYIGLETILSMTTVQGKEIRVKGIVNDYVYAPYSLSLAGGDYAEYVKTHNDNADIDIWRVSKATGQEKRIYAALSDGQYKKMRDLVYNAK